MKKILFAILLVFPMLICNCSCTTLEQDKDGNIIYGGITYVNVPGQSVFYPNFEEPTKVGDINGPLWSHREIGFSDFDLEVNVLFGLHYTNWMWLKEGFELPDIYKCRINCMRILGKKIVWESDKQFLTFNEMIDYETEKPVAPIKRHSLACYFEDYKYLRTNQIPVLWYNNRIYIEIHDNYTLTNSYYVLKAEYAEMFKMAVL